MSVSCNLDTCYPSVLRLDVYRFLCTMRISVHPVPSFPPTVLFPGAVLLPGSCLPRYRSGFLRSWFPCLRYCDCTTTAHCPSRSLIHILTVLIGVPLFRITPSVSTPLFPQGWRKARCIYIPPCPPAAPYLQRQ